MKSTEAIQRFLDSREARGLSPMTIKWYRDILKVFVQKFPGLPRSPEKIELFLSQCPGGDERRHGYYRALKCFYRFLKKRYKIPNPIELIESPRRINKDPNILTLIEIEHLLNFPHQGDIKAFLRFISDSGVRLGELASLDPKNIKETQWGYIAMVKGKTGIRTVPMSKESYRSLIKYLPIKYSKDYLGRKLSQAFKDARIPGTVHTLRHCFATYWEGDELVLQQILGHASLSTTRIYRHLRTKTLCEQHQEFSLLRMI